MGNDDEARQTAYRELFRYQLDPGMVDEIRAAMEAITQAKLGVAAVEADMKAQESEARIQRRAREQQVERAAGCVPMTRTQGTVHAEGEFGRIGAKPYG